MLAADFVTDLTDELLLGNGASLLDFSKNADFGTAG
jgi:hypothetical protein